MATNNQLVGITSPVPMGEWQASVPYKKLNIVKFNGTTYIAKKDNTDIQPETTSGWQEVWMGIADKGDTGDIGLYHTMSPSSTTVALSSLQPQGAVPIVGSAVLFSNGDVRQITGVNGSTVTLGDVLFSYKGDPGIGNATLSNIDGDSTENGFTQAAVKGVAQSKNYYNLGAFDTYVSNGDGTGTVTRKTGYNNDLNANLIKNGIFRSTVAGYEFGEDSGIHDIPINGVNFIATILPKKSDDELYYGEQGISINTKGCWICVHGLTTKEQYLQWLANNKILVQYELTVPYQRVEQVLENQPIHTLNQDGEGRLRDEWEKGLNLFSANKAVRSDLGAGLTILGKDSLQIMQGTQVYSRVVFDCKLEAGITYNFSANADAPTRVVIFDEDTDSDVIDIVNTTTFDFSFTATGNSFVYLYSSSAPSTIFSNIMLNKGNHPYPYQPYNGELVREKDLDSWAEGLNKLNFQNDIKNDGASNGTISINYATETITMQATDLDNYAQIADLQLKPRTTYVLSFSATQNYEIYVAFDGSDWSRVASNNPGTFTTKSSGQVSLRIDNEGGAGATCVFSNIMLNEGDKAIHYEPYVGEVVRTPRVPLYLTDNETSPAQLFGGSWTELGSFTVGSATIHAWKEV